MHNNQSKRIVMKSQFAALFCLAAFLMLIFSSSWHTCEDDCPAHNSFVNHTIITKILHHHHCVACEMLANDIGRTTFIPIFAVYFNCYFVMAGRPLLFILISTDFIKDASRSPPIA